MMHQDIDRIYFSESEIAGRIASLADELNYEYAGKEVILIGVLKGVLPFFADLTRRLTFPLLMDFVCVSSYGNTTTSGELTIKKDVDLELAGKHVLVVEDIIDSGNTLSQLLQRLTKRNPKSLKLCCFLDKPARRSTPLQADFVGFRICDEFVVGYGLDYAERYRNLPYIGVLKREKYENH